MNLKAYIRMPNGRVDKRPMILRERWRKHAGCRLHKPRTGYSYEYIYSCFCLLACLQLIPIAYCRRLFVVQFRSLNEISQLCASVCVCVCNVQCACYFKCRIKYERRSVSTWCWSNADNCVCGIQTVLRILAKMCCTR